MATSPFMQSVRQVLRTKRYSLKTEKVYLGWIKSFILFNDKKHPSDMGNHKIERFLNHLAVNRQVSSATQNQALCALIFLYRHVLGREITDLKFAFTVGKHVKSNAIIYVRNGATVGVGAGQMSRVNSSRIAATSASTSSTVNRSNTASAPIFASNSSPCSSNESR